MRELSGVCLHACRRQGFIQACYPNSTHLPAQVTLQDQASCKIQAHRPGCKCTLRCHAYCEVQAHRPRRWCTLQGHACRKTSLHLPGHGCTLHDQAGCELQAHRPECWWTLQGHTFCEVQAHQPGCWCTLQGHACPTGSSPASKGDPAGPRHHLPSRHHCHPFAHVYCHLRLCCRFGGWDGPSPALARQYVCTEGMQLLHSHGVSQEVSEVRTG